jgi:hypothetical protein
VGNGHIALNDVAVSPDGRTAVSADAGGFGRIRDLATGRFAGHHIAPFRLWSI